VHETEAELSALQDLLDRSRARATEHLREIITDDRVVTAPELVGLLAGMKVLALATVTARGEPRISAVDGHFLHGTWSFSTAGDSAKATHLARRPAVSIAHIDGEEFAVFGHGVVERAGPDDDDWDETLRHWTDHYGGSPLAWGDDIRLYRFDPTWLVCYLADRDDYLRRRTTPA